MSANLSLFSFGVSIFTVIKKEGKSVFFCTLQEHSSRQGDADIFSKEQKIFEKDGLGCGDAGIVL